jgi:hypothetical protein
MSVAVAFRLRALIIAAALGALALCGGCSALRIGYSTAPELVYWRIDAYADFDSEQSPRVREAVAKWFAWHRRTQLPDYAALLARAQTEVLADTTPARVCEWQSDLTKRLRTAFDRIAPATAELAVSLTPAQLQAVGRRQAKVNEAYRSEYLQPDAAERAAANLQRTVDRAESLYGRLDEGQRSRLGQLLARSPFDPELWLAERRQRQQDALQLLARLREGASRDEALAALRGYADQIERSPREPYRRYTERLNEFNCGVLATLHNTTSAAQRRYAANKLSGWEGDMRALAAAADPAAL